MSGVMGFKGKIYVKIDSTYTEVKIVGDVNVIKKSGETEVTTRNDGGCRTWAKGLREYGCSFFLQKRKGHAGYNAIRDAFRGDDETLDVIIADGDRTANGTDIVTMTVQVFDFTEDQKLGDAMGNNVVFKPTWSDTAPAESSVTTAGP